MTKRIAGNVKSLDRIMGFQSRFGRSVKYSSELWPTVHRCFYIVQEDIASSSTAIRDYTGYTEEERWPFKRFLYCSEDPPTTARREHDAEEQRFSPMNSASYKTAESSGL
jgi:hypothetical protein